MPEVAKQYTIYIVPLFKKECHLNCFSYVNSGAKKINAKKHNNYDNYNMPDPSQKYADID